MNLFAIIYILFLIIKVLNAQNVNKFCDNDRVDVAFNRGYNITVGSHESLWFYNDERHRMIEPAKPKSYLTGDDNVKILSTLFIEKTPRCGHQKQEECDQMSKALDLLFYKLFDVKENTEFTRVVRINAQNVAKAVPVSDYPWNLGSDLNVWPKEWKSDSSKSRPSAFNHNNLDAIFIANSGDPHKSMILWSSVSTNTWMNAMKSVKIHSNIHFVGMFFLRTQKMVYAIGDKPGDSVSRVYAIELDNNSTYFIRDIGRTTKEFFGCGKQTNNQSDPQSVSDTIYSTKTPIESVNTNPSGGHTDTIIIGVIIVILMVFGFIALIVVLVVFRIQGSKQKTSLTNSNSNAFQNSSAASVVTVNSQTGQTVKSQSKAQ